MTFLPNAITLSRIALAPVFILVLKDGDFLSALGIFLLAGISDGLDGFIAKRFNMQSRLGAILDPLADKILIVSAYVMLTIMNHIPFWLMLTVAFRDLMIISCYLIYTSMIGAVQMRPSYLSKLNTFIQISLIVLILTQQVIYPLPGIVIDLMIAAVMTTTIASLLHYVWEWGALIKDVDVNNNTDTE
jgi:cardiolipin synthase